MKEFWETALLGPIQALGGQLLSLLPNLLAMLILVAAGLLLAWVAGNGTERLLRVLGIDVLSSRLGVSAALARGGVKTDLSRLFGRSVYWIVIVFAIMGGLGALNVQPINQFAQSFLAYLPHLFTAAVILLAGYLLSNFVSQAVLIAAVNAGLPPARLVAALSRWGVQLIAIAMALEQMGIAANIVAVAFGITFGGIVLAAGLAFGLGGKDLAKDYLERRFGKGGVAGKDDLTHL